MCVCACGQMGIAWVVDLIMLPVIAIAQFPQIFNRKHSTLNHKSHTNIVALFPTLSHTHTPICLSTHNWWNEKKRDAANCCDIYRFAFIRWQQKLFLMLEIHLPISTSLFRLYAAYTQFYGICSLSCFQLVLHWRKLYWLLHHNIWLIRMPICDDSAVTTTVKRRSQMGY